MRASPNCIDVIKHFEVCRLVAYADPRTGGAPWTAMWGATGADIRPGDTFTQAQADARLISDVGEFEADATRALRVVVTQGMFDAFVDALYNIGHGTPKRDGLIVLRSGMPSTFLRLMNQRGFDGARDALGKWVSPGTNVEHGLHRRRVADQALFDGDSAALAIAKGDAA